MEGRTDTGEGHVDFKEGPQHQLAQSLQLGAVGGEKFHSDVGGSHNGRATQVLAADGALIA